MMSRCEQRYMTAAIGLSCLLSLIPLPIIGAESLWQRHSRQATAEEPKTTTEKKSDEIPVEYGVDVSFPIHHARTSDNYPWLPHNVKDEKVPAKYEDMVLQPLGDRNKFYNNLVEGCRIHYKKKGHLCDATERDRVAMNKRQPQSMQNYTDLGFSKIKAPAELYRLVKGFWEDNKHSQKPENWNVGNTYTNHWDAPTHMVSVEDMGLRGAGGYLKQKIWNAARDAISAWTEQELTECSLYGIRVYHEGAVLASHVDRLPLVSSAILNVAQDVDEPWPLEVIGHDGKAHNVTMEPGDLVLYESHSVVHGRPFPLKGRFYANVFIHFEPKGHSRRHHHKIAGADEEDEEMDVKYRRAVEAQQGGHEHDVALPPYVKEDTPEAVHWRQGHPGGWHAREETTFETGSTPAHHAAQRGDVKQLQSIAVKNKGALDKDDSNGWRPIHEGARAGHLDVVELLVEHGVDVNKRTNRGKGGTPLWLAKQSHGKHHPVTQFLQSLGALDVGPEL